MSPAGFPDDILLQLQVSRFSEAGGEEMDELDVLANGCFDDVHGLFDGGGDDGKIDRLRKIVDGSTGLDAGHFIPAGIHGIQGAGKTIGLQDLKIGQFSSAQIVGCADNGDAFGIKQRIEIHEIPP